MYKGVINSYFKFIQIMSFNISLQSVSLLNFNYFIGSLSQQTPPPPTPPPNKFNYFQNHLCVLLASVIPGNLSHI